MAQTLAEVQTDLAAARAALDAARRSVSYSQGDRQVTRAPLVALRQEVARLERREAELLAAAGGATNAGIITASWGG
jgi:hypothetical protein